MTVEGRGRRSALRHWFHGAVVCVAVTKLGSVAEAEVPVEDDGPAAPAAAAGFPAIAPPFVIKSQAAALRAAPQEEDQEGFVPPATIPHFEPVYSRWFAPGRPVQGLEPLPYEEVNETASPLNPYRQNILKGDFPILGTEDLFLLMSLTNRTIFNYRKVPTPSGITNPQGDTDPRFFGGNTQQFINNDLILELDLFKGQQAFKPVDWRLKVAGIFNYNYLKLREVGATKLDTSRGRQRTEIDWALGTALFEYHLLDWTDRYDFLAVEFGVLPFRSDFRGFIFDDVNLGARLLGNYDNNKWQYNLTFFEMLDKDTNSLLANFNDRGQNVIIANLYRQDWPVKGYITSFSFHYNRDKRGTHYDDNGLLISPVPVGFAKKNRIESYYLGWAGEGHLGRLNITHAYYYAFGEERQNPFAARDVDISAQLAALELSYDIDWWRIRVFGEYASGDNDARDGKATGFDAIIDAPNFAGGELSYFNGQAIRLLGVNLTNLFSPLPDLQSSRNEGQSNFVNPGLILVGGALDFEITPKLRAQVGSSYLRFVDTGVLRTYLELPSIDDEIGIEVFAGSQYRPFLNNHVNILSGATVLFPGGGFEKIYQSDSNLYSAFLQLQLTW